MRFSRTSRPAEVRSHELRREDARQLAQRSGAVIQAATGKGLQPFMPPTFAEMATAARRYWLEQRRSS